ncbi:MAG: extracellular solute-binding protein [Phycisphaeraceae bacterium]|nr:extracellular solute-binding protein [Phycisphaeraceae bacterium]
MTDIATTIRRQFPALALLLACAVLLVRPATARAGFVEQRGDKTVINVKLWWLPNSSATDPYTRGERAGIRAFKQRFPEFFAERYRDKYKADPGKYGDYNWDNVEVELEQFSGISVQGVETDLLAIAGDMAPDVLYVNFRKSDNYIQNNFLYPLDKQEDGYLTSMPQEQIDFRIHEKIWPVIRRKGPDGTKHVWAIPWGGALGKVLVFRKDLFDEHNVAYPTVQWTWDDMYEAARKLTNPEIGTYGLLLGRGKHESWYWVTFLWSAGGEVMVYNEQTDEWRCTFNTREAATALDMYVRLAAEKWTDVKGKIRRGYSYRDSNDSGTKWDRGEIGMIYRYIDEKLFSRLNPEVTGMVPVPLGPTGMRGGELNSRMMGLFSQIKNPAVRDAAWEFIRFYDSEEAVGIKTRIMVEGGLGRFVNPKYLRIFGYPEVERLSPKGWAETFEIAINTGKPEPYGRNSNVAYEMMTFPMHRAEELARNDLLPEDPGQRLDKLHELLIEATHRANEEMIGIISPEERRKRRIAATIVLVVLTISFALVFMRITRVFSDTEAHEVGASKWGFVRYRWAYILLAPAAGSILLWQYYPLGHGSVMAFQDYRIIGESTWVGIDNFGDLLFDNVWWQSCWNAVRYSFLVMSLTFLPPIVLAILLQEVPRGSIAFRIIYYLPAVITGLVTIVLWKQFYDPSDRGVLNRIMLHIPAIGLVAVGVILLILAIAFAKRLWRHESPLAAWAFLVGGVLLLWAFVAMASDILFPPADAIGPIWVKFWSSFTTHPAGIGAWAGDLGAVFSWIGRGFIRLFGFPPEAYNWLGDPDSAMVSCVIPMVWAGMGPGCLIYLAALKGIADDLYEAADIDGATFLDKILFVIFPILRPLVIINFIGVFISSFYAASGNILVMTGGGANTEVAGLHIWFKAFTYLKFGPATAMAWVLAFMLIGFTVYQLRILSRVEFRAADTTK